MCQLVEGRENNSQMTTLNKALLHAQLKFMHKNINANSAYDTFKSAFYLLSQVGLILLKATNRV